MDPTVNIEQQATQRVYSSLSLAAYADVLLSCNWGSREAHLTWVATASEADLLTWAERQRGGSQGNSQGPWQSIF